jgi:hypothetical protein
VKAKCRRREEAPTARRWRLGIFLLAPRICRAGSSTTPRWRIGVVALVHVGIAALARCFRLWFDPKDMQT